MNKVELKFKNKEINRNGISLYSKSDSLSFIEECERFGIQIFGIDGFFLTNDSIQPSLENSIDFTSKLFHGNAFREAIQFLRNKDDNLFFEITCQD